MHIYKRGKTYWFSTYHNNKRIRVSLKTTSKTQANTLAQKYIQELDQLQQNKRTLFMCLGDWFKMRKLKGSRIDTDYSIINKFLSEYKDIPIKDVNNSYLDQNLNVGNATYNRYVTVVLAAARLSSQTYKNAIPILHKKKVRSTRMNFLSKEQWLCLEQHLPGYLKPIVAFSLATGMRKSNVLNLKWSEVNLRAASVLVYADESKNKKQLNLPLNEWAIEILSSQLYENKDYVFCKKDGSKLVDPKKAFKKACRLAGIDNFRWHDLRHTFASWGLEAGMSLAELKELGGWSSLAMVLRYAHLCPNELSKVSNMLKKPQSLDTIEAHSKIVNSDSGENSIKLDTYGRRDWIRTNDPHHVNFKNLKLIKKKPK